jgi:hypothetical protein
MDELESLALGGRHRSPTFRQALRLATDGSWSLTC